MSKIFFGISLTLLATVIALGQCLRVLAGPVKAQPAPAAAAPLAAAPLAAAPRIAIANLEAVLQNYKRMQMYKAEVEKEFQPFRTQSDELKKKIDTRQAELKVANFDAAKRKQVQDALNADIKKLQELEREAAGRNGQKIEKELIPIHREIQETIKTYARSNGIHVVLSYSQDPKIDPLSPASIVRKVNGLESTGCVTPLYVDPAADITGPLTEALNRRYEAALRK